MDEFDKAGQMLEKWKEHDHKNGWDKGIPDYPTNVGFIKAMQEETNRFRDNIILNALTAKQTRINGQEILEKVVSRFIIGTEYTATEVIEIMLKK